MPQNHNGIDEIEVVVLSGGFPVVKLNGKRLCMEDRYLSELQREMEKVIKNGLQNIKGVSALDGKIVPHTSKNHAQSLEQLVSFSMIIIDDSTENICDHHLTDKIRPFLALLVWHKSAHFTRVIGTGSFECLVCGKRHFTNYHPNLCENNDCFSHQIERPLYTSISDGKRIHRDTL